MSERGIAQDPRVMAPIWLFILPMAALALDVAICVLAPLQFGRWLAYCPVGRKRRFRYLVPEDDDDSLAPVSEPVLDRSLEAALRVVRDVRIAVRFRHEKAGLLCARARWVKDELEVSIRFYPVVFIAFTLSAGFFAGGLLGKDAGKNALSLLFAVIFALIPLISLSTARRGAESLTLELLELARPRKGALPFEITRDGKLVPVGRRLRSPQP